MFCTKCGKELKDGDLFCTGCGAPVKKIEEETKPVVENTAVQEEVQAPEVKAEETVQEVKEETKPVVGNTTVQQAQEPVTPKVEPTPVEQPQATVYHPVAPQKKNNTALIIAVVACAAVLVLLIILIAMVVGSDDSQSQSTTNSTTTESSTTTTTSKKTSSTYTVYFEDFKFSIPDDLIYEKDDDLLYLADEDYTWCAQIQVVEGSYSSIKQNKSQLQSAFAEYYSNVSAAEIKEIDGVEFVTVEVKYSGTNMIIAYTKANSMYVYGLVMYTEDNEFDYDVLGEIGEVLSTGEYQSSTNNLEDTVDLPDVDISDLITE